MNIKSKIQEECLKAIGNNKNAGVILGTGSGKTLLGLKHMASKYTDYSLFLVVTPKLSIQEEWIAQAKEFGLNYLLKHIKFTTYLSLHKENITYDYVYLDECHNLKIKHEKWLQLYNGPTLGLTGSYPKYKTSESFIVCDKFCPVVYEYNIEDGINDHMLNDYKIYVHLLELDSRNNYLSKTNKLSSEQSNYRMWDAIINKAKGNDLQMKRIMRMKAIQSYNTKVTYAQKLLKEQIHKTLVFTDFTEQADLICEHSYHSKNPMSKNNLEKFKSGEINKLSSVLQIAEGVNIPNLKVGIILHAYANEKKLKQKIGRFLRLNPDDKSTIHVLCYNNTIDLKWCKQSLKDFDSSKIFKYNV